MKNGRIILKATLKNESPVVIGSGRNDRSDRDILTTIYPIGPSNKILTLEKISEAVKMKEMPFIPATSFLGKIFSCIIETPGKDLLRFRGDSENFASFIDCSDVLLTDIPYDKKGDPLPLTETRDGIRIDSSQGIVAQGAKFDYELLPAGSSFETTLIFRVEEFEDDLKNKDELTDFNTAIELASTIKSLLEKGIYVGANSTNGFGLLKGNSFMYELDFDKPADLKYWIENKLYRNEISTASSQFGTINRENFEINATFSIKNSLIIRSYSKDPDLPDSTHLKSGGKNILSGSSIKGALRGRAERILNTIQKVPDQSVTLTILTGLFGDVEKKSDEVKVKKDGYTVPSRVFVDEISIEDVKEEIQTRIQIDRFTGATVDGALIEEMPLFPVKDKEHLKNFRIKIKNATDTDKGLMLLLLKDLWTADLPIGGEKSIGRGVLNGIKATVFDGELTFTLEDDFSDPEKVKTLQRYVDELNKLNNFSFYATRVNYYKEKKYGNERT
jgi:CRISPR/Cas system CSM-associated protein Csm3 (group 7 of RAMP superfamily)